MADQGITREGRGEEQPKDKERAQTAHKTFVDPEKGNRKQQGGHHLPPDATEDPMDDTDRNSDKVLSLRSSRY